MSMQIPERSRSEKYNQFSHLVSISLSTDTEDKKDALSFARQIFINLSSMLSTKFARIKYLFSQREWVWITSSTVYNDLENDILNIKSDLKNLTKDQAESFIADLDLMKKVCKLLENNKATKERATALYHDLDELKVAIIEQKKEIEEKEQNASTKLENEQAPFKVKREHKFIEKKVLQISEAPLSRKGIQELLQTERKRSHQDDIKIKYEKKDQPIPVAKEKKENKIEEEIFASLEKDETEKELTLAQQLRQTVKSIKDRLESTNKFTEINTLLSEYNQTYQIIDDLIEGSEEIDSSDVDDLLDDVSILLRKKLQAAKTLLPIKTEELKKNRLENCDLEELTDYLQLVKFLNYFGLIKNETSFVSFIKDIQEEIFNHQAMEAFNAINEETFNSHQEELATYLSQEKNCDPRIFDRLLQKEDLLKLIAADLFMPVHLPQVAGKPPGLFNQGNSCYRNSTTQMLLHSPLAAKFEKSLISTLSLLKNIDGTPEAALDRMQDLLKVSVAFKQLINVYAEVDQGKYDQMLQKKMKLSDRALVHSLITTTTEKFMLDLTKEDLYQQQDAAAYLGALLNVFGIEGGVLETKWVPNTGVTATDVTNTLIVPIQRPNGSLQALLDDCFVVSKQKASFRNYNEFNQKTQLANLTDQTLLVQLKRRVYNVDQGEYYYNDIPISFDLNTPIDLQKGFDADRSIPYMMIGFTSFIPSTRTNESGKIDKSGSRGHYISFVKRDNQWYKCDDSSVSLATEEELKRAQKGIYLIALSP